MQIDRVLGSSPRMRGAPRVDHVGRSDAGIIPADAGSTTLLNTALQLRKDHPRGCGEHRLFMRDVVDAKGSSPRIRGARMPLRQMQPPVRIIPADAGSTARSLTPVCATLDHPRGCGEHRSIGIQSVPNQGSSPRMRGALGPGPRVAVEPGIIPADAGSTSASNSSTT